MSSARLPRLRRNKISPWLLLEFAAIRLFPQEEGLIFVSVTRIIYVGTASVWAGVEIRSGPALCNESRNLITPRVCSIAGGRVGYRSLPSANAVFTSK